MGSYCTFSIDDDELYVMSYPDAAIMTIFNDSDKCICPDENAIAEALECIEEDESYASNEAKLIAIAEAKGSHKKYVYASKAYEIIDRLEVMGFTLESAVADCSATISGHFDDRLSFLEFEDKAYYDQEVLRINEANEVLKKIDLIQSYSNPTAFRAFIHRYLEGIENDEWFPQSNIRYAIRLILESKPRETRVELNYTELVHNEYYSPECNLCRENSDALWQDYKHIVKILIFTEGKTDSELIQESIRTLYPHLKGYYTFLNFTD